MKTLRNVMILILLSFVVVGCSPDSDSNKSEEASEPKSEDSNETKTKDSTTNSSESPLQTIFKKSVEVRDKWMKLPEEFQTKVVVPELETIPFVIDRVDVFTLATGVLPPGVKTNFDIILKSKTSFPRVHVTAFDVDGQKPTFGKYTSTVTLNNDVKGYFTKNEQEKSISWLNEDKTIRYLVRYMEGKSEEVTMKKEELVKAANSMIEQNRQNK